MRADPKRSRTRARSASVLAAVVVTGGVLAASTAPAAAAAPSHKPPKPSKVSAHGHGPAHHPAHTTKHAPAPTAARMKPRTKSVAVVRPSAGHTAPTRSESWAPSTYSAPAPKSTPKPAPTAVRAPSRVVSTWRRDLSARDNRGVVRAFTTDLRNAGRSAGFPALLVAVMAVFLLVQHRLDRRDVKLSHADWATDQGLEFSAPSTIRR